MLKASDFSLDFSLDMNKCVRIAGEAGNSTERLFLCTSPIMLSLHVVQAWLLICVNYQLTAILSLVFSLHHRRPGARLRPRSLQPRLRRAVHPHGGAASQVEPRGAF